MSPISGTQVTSQEIATEVLRLGDKVDTFQKEFQEHKADQSSEGTFVNNQIAEIRNDLMTRPPLWVTAVIGILGTMLGAASGIAYFAMNQVAIYQHELVTIISAVKN